MVSRAGPRATPRSRSWSSARRRRAVTVLSDALFDVALDGGLGRPASSPRCRTPEGAPVPRRRATSCSCSRTSRIPATSARCCAAPPPPGAAHVLLSTDCVFAWSLKVVRAAMGAHFALNIVEGADLARVPRRAIAAPRWRSRARRSARSTTSTCAGPLAILVGNEGAGLSRGAACARATRRGAHPDARCAWNRSTPASPDRCASSRRCGKAVAADRRSARSRTLSAPQGESETTSMKTPARRQYKYYEFVMVAFVTILVCSNLIGPAKIAQVDLPLVGVITFGAGVLFFPISYVFGDILTEVYGYARSRPRDLGRASPRSPSPRSWRGRWWRCRRRRSGRTRRPTRSRSATPGASRSPRWSRTSAASS